MNDHIKPNTLSDIIARMEAGDEKPFAVCQHLADKVADLMLHDDARAESCLQFIADTYNYTTSNVVRLAIENCFIYHLGTRIFTSNEYSRLLKQLPQNLHNILMRQMMATGL